MKSNDETKIIEIFAGTHWQRGMVKTLPENAGISAYIADKSLHFKCRL